MSKRVASLLLGTALAVLLVASVGCGGGDDDAADGGGEPIRIGAPIPMTGPWAADGETMEEGLQMAVDEINDAGGVLGRQLELVVYDVEDMAPEKLNAAASKLAMQQKVSAVITGYSTPGADVTAFGKYPQPYIQFDASSQNIAMVTDDPEQYGHVFTLGDIEAPYGEQTFKAMLSLPYEYPNNKVVIIAGDFEWDKKITEGIRAAAQAEGWDVALYEVVPYGTREWGPLLTKIRQIDPAIIHVAIMDPADEKTFLSQFSQNPTNSLVEVGYAISIQGFVDLVGEAGEGVVGISTSSVLPDEMGDDFRSRFEEKYGKQPGLSIVGTCYDGVMLWAEGVKVAGDPDDYAAVAEAMKSLNYKGVQGTYAFRDDNSVPATDAGLPMFFFQVQDGDLVLLKAGTQDHGEFVNAPWID